jgi:hypothetical protein
MVNNFVFILFILFQLNTSELKHNPLLNTKWQFSGYVYKNKQDSVKLYPNWVIYTLEFKDHNKLAGKAGLNYRGRYKLIGINKIQLYPNILKASDPDYPTQEEFNYREEFTHALGSKGPYLFLLKDNELHIFIEKNIVMLFKRI